MKTYRFARFLCWIVVVAGLLGAIAMLLVSVLGIFTILGSFTPYLLTIAVGGVLVALVGFALLAFFDIAQAVTSEPNRFEIRRDS